jgi:hypothetical protein
LLVLAAWFWTPPDGSGGGYMSFAGALALVGMFLLAKGIRGLGRK